MIFNTCMVLVKLFETFVISLHTWLLASLSSRKVQGSSIYELRAHTHAEQNSSSTENESVK